MRYTEYDYGNVSGADSADPAKELWSAHWKGRVGIRDDCMSQSVWPAIKDIVCKPGRLLEAGCGIPQWVQFFHQRGFQATGVDYDNACLEIGRAANPSLNLVQADLRRLPFPDESFDYVLSFGAVEHAIEGPEPALKELHRVLAADGWLLCSVPCLNMYRRAALPWMIFKNWLRHRAVVRRAMGRREQFVFYEYHWTPGAYRRILQRVGFRVVELRSYGVSHRIPCLDALIRQVSHLGNAHMMLAICTKDKVLG